MVPKEEAKDRDLGSHLGGFLAFRGPEEYGQVNTGDNKNNNNWTQCKDQHYGGSKKNIWIYITSLASYELGYIAD